MMWLVGVGPFLLVHLPITLLASSIGVWLFYVQHQFEETFWAEAPAWTVHEAALHGSSHYDLPRRAALVHRQHRRAPRAPPLQPHSLLPAAARAARPSRAEGGRTAHPHGELRCVRLVLWDESSRRLISFRDLRQQASAPMQQT